LCISKTRREDYFSNKRPLFYYITDRRRLAGISLASCIQRALDRGVGFIQIREKDLHERALFELTCRVVNMARGTQCKVLVNGRADIALAAGAHGVHLPSSSLQVSDIRKWLPAGFLAGVSVHTMQEIMRARKQNADYILVGHVFPTESKAGFGPSVGLDFLRKACAAVPVPIFGLGGIRPENINAVLECGAAGVAGISLFQKRDAPHFPNRNRGTSLCSKKML
jgi:thiamine-phosphate pyrophosphorylase